MEIIKAHCTSYPGRTTAAKLLLYLNLKDDEHRQLVQGDVTLIDYWSAVSTGDLTSGVS